MEQKRVSKHSAKGIDCKKEMEMEDDEELNYEVATVYEELYGSDNVCKKLGDIIP